MSELDSYQQTRGTQHKRPRPIYARYQQRCALKFTLPFEFDRNMTEGFPSGTVSAMHVNGRHNWLVIGEFPDDKACASAVLPAAAGGSLSDIETTAAMRAKDAHATFVSAGQATKTFWSAGRA